VDVFAELTARNAAFAAEGPPAEVPQRPTLALTVISCMDTRLDVPALLGLRPGEALILRNGGGVVTDDVVRSLVIAERLLGCRNTLLLHHSRCGKTNFTDEGLRGELADQVGFAPPFTMEPADDLWVDLRQQAARLHASPYLTCKDTIRTAMYDEDTGRIEHLP
jgi:carbonic anhydrase